MSSGRSNVINCAHFGTIEFIHTKQPATELLQQLHYDQELGMWKASIKLAINDMKKLKEI